MENNISQQLKRVNQLFTDGLDIVLGNFLAGEGPLLVIAGAGSPSVNADSFSITVSTDTSTDRFAMRISAASSAYSPARSADRGKEKTRSV